MKYPTEELPGVSLVSEKEIKTENGKRVVLTFDGEKSFTLVQEKAEIMPATASASSMIGEPVDLGFTIGALSENRITWTYQGVDYSIASKDLTREEMEMVARSVQGDAIK